MANNDIETINRDGFIDTNNQDMLNTYRNNLYVLVERAKKEGIRRFKIIREDDFFPYDSMWRANTCDTYLEYAPSSIAASLRRAAVNDIVNRGRQIKTPFEIPIPEKEERKAYESLDRYFGYVLEPVKYRSTKHFTINTPLEYTGSYNQVSSDRNFIVIDDIDNFINSGYGYSMDYRDAYLDISHENLAISSKAIYLIREERYREMLNNPVMREQLANKRVIRFVGDPAIAINMILTEEGVLPYRVSGKDMDYDPALGEIFLNSMRDLCSRNNIDYSRSHGNMFGKGGHFSDLLDEESEERINFERSLSNFIRKRIPQLQSQEFNIYHNIDRIIQLIGYQELWKVIQEFNAQESKHFLNRIREYDLKHDLDSETHNLFIETIKKIKELYDREETISCEIKQLICRFFHSSTKEEQIEAAKEIKNLVNSNMK